MFEPNGYVNYWTEFLVAHVGALHDYTLEYADYSLAAALWNAAPINPSGSAPELSLGILNYSLTAYYNTTDSMVHDTPKPLIDWPRSSGIDTDATTSRSCSRLCSQMNGCVG